MSELMKAQNSELSLEFEEAVKKSIMPKNSTQADFCLFLEVVRATRLNPLTKQIYALMIRGRLCPLTSIDGYRVTAQRTGQYEGQVGPYWCGDDGEWKDVWLSRQPPAAAKVGVYRKGFREPVFAVAKFSEYNVGKDMWGKMPSHMIAKVAESLALRRCFPNDLSGARTEEEMEKELQDLKNEEAPIMTTSQEVKSAINDAIALEPKKDIKANKNIMVQSLYDKITELVGQMIKGSPSGKKDAVISKMKEICGESFSEVAKMSEEKQHDIFGKINAYKRELYEQGNVNGEHR